ncbi:translocating chain-associated membrane protein 2-like [Sinocyclocheilus rhinocerous]|uniref:Translocating chain-associated membrane protein 2-like n=1 Tax=Sinocyclocheilus rhinocerous TaxID=307959 RepID=A0A673HP38_9TELE|nr:PREDICTED: translocating chain-associated membrane protein 2-like [Sinocyclocheilus rhinocerous]
MAFRRRNKSYPFFSQEFLIQNHADIVFSLVIFILIGLMFETTAKTAILFIQPQYNISTMSADGEVTLYLYGWKDCATVLFYLCITIILHAVVQEYVLDKVNRRLHLSKSKNTKFNESGQLCVFYLVSSLWSLYVIATEGYLLHPSSLWENYPHVHLRYIHTQTQSMHLMKTEEIPRQLQYISLYLLHILAAYLLNLTRVGLVLLFLQYLSEMGFHLSRLFYFIDENHHKMFEMWSIGFVLTRMITLTLMFLAVGFGLARSENQTLDLEVGNFNTLSIRLLVLFVVCFTQSWLLWKFFRFQLSRTRELRLEQVARKRVAAKQQMQRTLKRDSVGYYENGLIKAENGTSPRLKKIKAP